VLFIPNPLKFMINAFTGKIDTHKAVVMII